MKFRFTGTGLIIGSIFAMGASLAVDPKSSVYAISVVGVLFFYVCMAFAMSQMNVGPKISLIAVILGLLFSYGLFMGSHNLGISIFFFSCMASAFSFAIPAK